MNESDVLRDIKRDITVRGEKGWGVTVWLITHDGEVYSRRVVFETRDQARHADLETFLDSPGFLGYAR